MGDVGRHCCIAIGSDTFPVISYLDATKGNLKVVHCTSVNCSTFDTPTSLAPVQNFHTSIAENIPTTQNNIINIQTSKAATKKMQLHT